MLSSMRYQDEKREEGFTLIELLVVVIIIGILAAIAIPVFLNQRQNAWRGAAETDARNAAIAIEGFYTSERRYPADDEVTEGADDGLTGPIVFELEGTDDVVRGTITVSQDVTLVYELDESGESYTITATHEQLEDSPVAVYNSATGGLLRDVAGE